MTESTLQEVIDKMPHDPAPEAHSPMSPYRAQDATFTPRLDKYAQAVIREKTQVGDEVFLVRSTPSVCQTVTCQNCNDLNILYFFVCNSPSNTPYNFARTTFANGKFWRVKETLTFACSVCNAMKMNRYNALAEMSGLLPHELSWRVDYIAGPDNNGLPGKKNAYRAALDFLMAVPNPSGLLMFYGNNGTGKSGLLKSLVAQAITAGVPAHYTTAAGILTRIRATYGDRPEMTEQELMSWYGGYPVLVIDEVDVINQTGWAETTMRDLLNGRYDRRFLSWTGIATNAKPEDLHPYLNSRWQDGARILIGGQDLRGQHG